MMLIRRGRFMALVYQRTGACQGWLSINVMIVEKKDADCDNSVELLRFRPVLLRDYIPCINHRACR
jgi:hypothetical protein